MTELRGTFRMLIVRVASQPLGVLEALRPPRTTALLDRLLELPRRRRDDAVSLPDEIGAIVPKQRRELRRTLLELRRAVHSDRPPRLQPAELREGLAALPPEVGDRVETWLAAHEEEATHARAAADTLHEEMKSAVFPKLRSILNDADFAAGLVHAKSSLWSALHAAGDRARPAKPSREELSLAAFLIRAAAKTSPFGRFMRTGACPLGGPARVRSAFAARATGQWCTAYPDRSLIALSFAEAVRRAAGAAPVPCTRNPTLKRLDESRYSMQTNRYMWINGHLWREQHLSSFRCDERLAAAIEALPEQFDSDVALSAFVESGLGPTEATSALRRLLDTGAIVPEPYTDCYAEHPLLGCAEYIARLEGQERRVTPLLASIELASERFGNGGAAARQEALATLGDIARTIEPDVDRRSGARAWIGEDVFLDGVQGGLSTAVLEGLELLRSELRRQLRVRSEYALLHSRFRERFGSGGACADVADFLLGAAAELAPVLSGLRDAESVFRPTMPAEIEVPEDEPVGVTVVFQVDTAESQHEMIVVNRVYEGVGWLSARTVGALASHDPHVLVELRRWLHEVAGDREPVAFPVCGECNNLQRHPRVTDRTLVWPGEPLMEGGAARLDLHDLKLVDDPVTGRLEFIDAGGVRVVPVMLGGVYPTPAWGARYLMLSIAQPYVIGRPTFTGGAPSPNAVVYYPRISIGKIVLKRASWSLPAELVRRFPKSSIADAMLAALRLFETEGIPAVVFAHGGVSRRLGIADTHIDLRKPLWIDLRNPICLELLQRVARRADYVLVEEMLPTTDGLCVEIDGKAHVSELQVEMLI